MFSFRRNAFAPHLSITSPVLSASLQAERSIGTTTGGTHQQHPAPSLLGQSPWGLLRAIVASEGLGGLFGSAETEKTADGLWRCKPNLQTGAGLNPVGKTPIECAEDSLTLNVYVPDEVFEKKPPGGVPSGRASPRK